MRSFFVPVATLLFVRSSASSLRGPPVIQSEEEGSFSRELDSRSLRVDLPKSVENGLIVRIVGVDTLGNPITPILSESEAYNRAFGLTNSAAEQFYGCSGGDFSFIPFKHTSLRTNGVLTIKVDDKPYPSHIRASIREAADSKICDALRLPSDCQSSLGIDHKLFIMPAGLSDGNQYGFLSASVGGDYSIYGDSSAYNAAPFDVEGILHELAHNWRLGHAYENEQAYGDNTGPMGSSYYLWGANNGNRRCFNGYNMHALQWQSARIIEVSDGESGTVLIGGVADESILGDTDYLVVKYRNLFVMYNRKKGINDSTKEYPDKVLVHESRPRSLGSDYIDSHLIGVLGPADEGLFGDFTVKVCEAGSSWPLTTVKIAVGAGASCLDETLHQTVTTTTATTILPRTEDLCSVECASGMNRICISKDAGNLDRCVPTSWLQSLMVKYPGSYCGACA